MLVELSSVEVLVANLALDHHLGALAFDMLIQLSPGHVLEVFVIADVTAELWAVSNSVLL